METFDFLIFRQMIHHLYLRSMEPVQKTYGLTQMEEDILLFLANNPGHDTAAELVSLRALAKSQVSTSVERLVCKGYLARKPEGRKIHLQLLPASEGAVAMGRECQLRFAQTLTEGLCPEEQKQMCKLLGHRAENARRACREAEGEKK